MNITKLNTTMASAKGLVAKVLTVGFLAGAVALALPAKAQAQEVFVGGGFYPRHDFYERGRFEEIRRHDAWVRAEEFRRYQRECFYRDRFYRGYR